MRGHILRQFLKNSVPALAVIFPTAATSVAYARRLLRTAFYFIDGIAIPFRIIF